MPRVSKTAILLWGGEEAGGDVTPPTYDTGVDEIGDVDSITVVVAFNEDVTATDFADGVTIEVNAVPDAVVSATLQGDNRTVYYTIDTDVDNNPVDQNDVVTWEYDSGTGNIEDLAGNPLADVTPQTVDNRVGMHIWFNELEDAGWLIHTL